MMRFVWAFCISVFFLASCELKTSTVEKKAAPDTEKLPANPTLQQLDPRLLEADSLVFVFYTDPYRADSLRYTRFYRVYESVSGEDIGIVSGALVTATQRLEKTRPCRSEGKIWCFKQGGIFQTLYFSTKKPDCHFLYLIRDGFFYYAGLPEPLENLLKALSIKAHEVPGQGVE